MIARNFGALVGPRKAVRLRLVQVHPILMVAQHLAMTRRLLDTSRWLSSKISEMLDLDRPRVLEGSPAARAVH